MAMADQTDDKSGKQPQAPRERGGWLAKRRGEGKGDDSTTCVKLTGRAINLHTFLYDRKTTSMMNEMAIQTQG